MQNEIAIIDFGGQYTHLIARRVRNLGIFSEIYSPENFSLAPHIKGIIFSGGPQSVNAKDASKVSFDIKNSPVPIMGICYGHQLIAHLSEGVITSGTSREYGYTEISRTGESRLLADTPTQQRVWMSHGDHVDSMPQGFTVTASTDDIPVAAYEAENGSIFGVQFHPEVYHTSYGTQILDNFISICNVSRDWKAENFKESLIQNVVDQAKDNDLLILLSGGVDSLVAMELCLEALGKKRVFAVHIDTGFMRWQESQKIIQHLESLGYSNLKLINAQDRFLEAIRDVYDPEQKRLIIGKLFVDEANAALAEFDDKNVLLVQGTIYPDTIESGESEKSAKIKTHHNRVAEIEKLIAEGKIIEPIKDLYKDEVRKLGIELNIPAELVNRHPFPGPGLAIRILASNSIENTADLDDVRCELHKTLNLPELNSDVLAIRSVGVMGDFRTYEHPVLLSYKNNKNHSWNQLRQAARIAVNNISQINRALFALDMNGEYKLGLHQISHQACDQLREVDHLLMEQIKNIPDIWQMPVVQLPLFDDHNRQVYVMRPVTSIDAMTADFYEMDFALLKNLISQVRRLPFVADLFYDITSKPPATIEWE